MRTSLTALAVLLSVSLLDARQERLTCGSHPHRTHEELQLHKQAQRDGIKRLRKATAARVAGEAMVDGRSVRPDNGNLAILDDSDGVVARRNPFNLNKRTLRFVPSDGSAKYRYEMDGDTYDAAAAAGGTVISGIGDDDTREVPLPFSFPFFGTQYGSVYVNSDGNLTFGSGDIAITDRSLGRFTSGSPRIAMLFTDLDPTRARTGITTFSDSNRFVVSWVQVPEYRGSGTGPLQTFQVRLFTDGRIEMAWSEATSQEVVTGISPGRLQGSAAVVSFVNTPSSEYTAAIAERFSGQEQVDIFSAAQKFYLNHDDAYDYLVIYNTLGIDADTDAVAYEVTVRNNRTGYGDLPAEAGTEAGSKRRLQAILNMGPTVQYPSDPNLRVPARFTVGDTPTTTLAHEAGHLFLAFASIRDENDDEARPMLGFQTAHWNFLFNSEASLLEGNRIEDRGAGVSPRFRTTATVEGFSPLDQYLMGFRPPEEVPDMFLVTNASGSKTSGLPQVGITLNGERRNIRIDEIIQAEGRRTPDHTVAQRRFRFGFIIITEAGTEPTPAQLAQVEAFRSSFESFFGTATSNRASADTTLKRALRVSVWPAAGVTLGATGTGTVSIEKPTETPVTVLLRPSGAVSTPASVTIPAGSTSAEFRFTGQRAGVDDLVLEAADSQYETVHTKIQVAAAESLRLLVASGDLQTVRPGTPIPVQVRVTDINNVPYPGITVGATISAGGQIDQASAVSDENGIATFRWTPGVNAENELSATIPGGANVIVTALGRPTVAANAVVNAASFAAGLTPGGIGTAFGWNLAGNGTVSVLVNGRSVPVFYSGTRQVNFYLPLDVPTGTVDLAIRTGLGTSEASRVSVTALQPGIFYDVPSGYGAITGAGTGQVTQVRPVAKAETIEIYSTGLGQVQEQPNGWRTTTITPRVLIGGAPAEVTFSGLAPGYTGLYQINAVVPANAASGTQTVSLEANGIRSNEVKIQVR